MTENLTTRSRLGMAALLSAPVVLAIASLVTPEVGDTGTSLVAGVGSQPSLWTLGWAVTAVGSALYLLGFAHLASRLQVRARLAWAGLVLFWLGAFGEATLAATELLIVPIAKGDKAAAAATVDRIGESPALASLFLLYLPGILFGGILLFLGLAKARLVPLWAGLLGAAGALLGFFLGETIPGFGLLTAAAMAWAFASLLRTPVRDARPDVTDRDVVPA